MTRRRALVVCPGRGSYGREQLGYLAHRGEDVERLLEVCDAWRASKAQPGVRELDAADAFRASRHVAGEHASLLTFACSVADWLSIDDDRYEIVGVTGNSMGWYTALACSGALRWSEAIRLVDTMGAYQAGQVIGGQIMYPVYKDTDLVDADRLAAVQEALRICGAEGHTAEWSIRLGGIAVLGADRDGLKRLQELLPPITKGDRTFPAQLPLHSAFHTSLLRATAARAQQDLADLDLRAPKVPLIDGRGYVFRPHHASPQALLAYTLGPQVTETYDFDAALRCGLRHTGAEVVILLGPGNSLGGPTSRLLCAEGWAGVRERHDLLARAQAGAPLLLSFGDAEQRRLLA